MDGMGAAARSYRVFFSLYEKLEEWQGFQRFQLYYTAVDTDFRIPVEKEVNSGL